MLTVTLYEFKKRENSTKRPTGSATQRDHRAVLKMPTSLLRPEITFDFGLKGNPSFYNYAYISDLGNRYYFIKDWTVSEGHLWTAHMEVDVLASWKASIGESTQYVKRSSYTYDGGILDPVYPTIQPPEIVITKDNSNWTTDLKSGTYILGIINNQDGGMGAAHYYAYTQENMNKFLNILLSSTEYAGNITEITADLLKVLWNPMQYVISCVWYPFSIELNQTANVTKLEKTPIGWWEISVPCYQLNTTMKYFANTVAIPKHPQAATRGVYLSKQPFSSYTLYYPGVGQIVLDPSLLQTDNLAINCAVDLIANQARLVVNDVNTCVSYAQIGVPIQLAQMAEQTLQQITGAFTGAMGTGSKAAMAGLEAGGPLAGAIAGIGGAVFSAIGNAVEHAFPVTTTTSSNGSLVNLAYSVSLKAVFYKLVPEDNADLGRPLCQARKISSVPGYQMIMHADVAIAGTREENQMIKNYMESGYFYE